MPFSAAARVSELGRGERAGTRGRGTEMRSGTSLVAGL